MIDLELTETLFAVLTVASCLTGSKMVDINIFGNHIYTPASAFCFVITYFLSNLISYISSESCAKMCIMRGVVCQIIATILFFLIGLLPAQHAETQDAYMKILGSSWILVAGSLIAFAIAQFTQIKLFEFLKETAKPAISNYISMLVSQIVDTSLFSLIAFGLGQKMIFAGQISLLIHIIITQYIIKILILTLVAPLFSAILKRTSLRR